MTPLDDYDGLYRLILARRSATSPEQGTDAQHAEMLLVSEAELAVERARVASLKAESMSFSILRERLDQCTRQLHELRERSKEPLKPHEFRELVNELRDVARTYHATEQLREQIARTLRKFIPCTKEDA